MSNPIVKPWYVVHPSHMMLPDEPPEVLLTSLLDVIDMIDGYPTPEQLRAIKRLANSIREEQGRS